MTACGGSYTPETRRKYFISGPQWAAAYEGNALFHAPTRGTLDFDTVIPGHGPVSTKADVVAFRADLETMRTRLIGLVKQGESPAKVAHFLGCGRSSVYTWVKLDRDAAERLAARPHTGPKPRLTDEQAKELEGLLLEGAKAHGWHNDLWSAHRVAEVIRRHFGVEYHVEHARKVIRRRLGWSSQKPQKEARQRNDEAIAH